MDTCKLPQVNALRKGRSGAYSEEETRLKSSRAEDNGKVILVTMKLYQALNIFVSFSVKAAVP